MFYALGATAGQIALIAYRAGVAGPGESPASTGSHLALAEQHGSRSRSF